MFLGEEKSSTLILCYLFTQNYISEKLTIKVVTKIMIEDNDTALMPHPAKTFTISELLLMPCGFYQWENVRTGKLA